MVGLEAAHPFILHEAGQDWEVSFHRVHTANPCVMQEWQSKYWSAKELKQRSLPRLDANQFPPPGSCMLTPKNKSMVDSNPQTVTDLCLPSPSQCAAVPVDTAVCWLVLPRGKTIDTSVNSNERLELTVVDAVLAAYFFIVSAARTSSLC